MVRRKNHVKKERVELKLERAVRIVTPENIIFLDNHEEKVYRFFSEAQYADAFACGDIFLSTLQKCRNYENAEQGDTKEGHEEYYIDHMVGGSHDPQFVEQARRVGFHDRGGNSNITFSNVVRKTRITDAYVLCTTTNFSPEKLNDTFGAFCVEITNPRDFFLLLSEKIKAISNIRCAAAGKVIYADNRYTGMNSPNGRIGFVKAVVPYADQKEFRFLWHMEQQGELDPFVLKCPEVSGMCKRIA